MVKRLILQLLGIFAGILFILFTIKWDRFYRVGVSITSLLEWENILLECGQESLPSFYVVGDLFIS